MWLGDASSVCRGLVHRDIDLSICAARSIFTGSIRFVANMSEAASSGRIVLRRCRHRYAILAEPGVGVGGAGAQ